jgi:hypothetical protein
MQNFQDNTKYVEMIRTRPALNLIPTANKRILGQRVGITGAILFGLTSTISLLLYKYYLDGSSLYLIKTEKKFNFESDPYSGKVKCNYTEVPNRQHGF